MSNELAPRGEDLRRAVRWISYQRVAGTELTIAELVNEACLRFDLSPLDAQYLWDTFVEQPASPGTSSR
jgi:hypothetical protein